uniref:Secreted protein n=1 Tax=Angiostrongylus cantonensis TaxID=6313 RepID=A0A0K0DKZ7_ANGCA
MRLMQIAFGFSSAVEVAYCSYLCAIVNGRKYRRMESYDRSADRTRTSLPCSLAHVPISPGTATYLTLKQPRTSFHQQRSRIRLNTFVAVVFRTGLTLLVVDVNGLRLDFLKK